MNNINSFSLCFYKLSSLCSFLLLRRVRSRAKHASYESIRVVEFNQLKPREKLIPEDNLTPN